MNAVRRPSLRRLAAILAVLLLGAWLRCSNHPLVFDGGEVLPLSSDAVYHLRRSIETLEHFPSVPVRDPLINWPAGGDCHWAPGFDFVSALPPLVLGLAGRERAAAAVIVCVPVVLGLLIVLLCGSLARRLSPAGETSATSALAMLLCATLPICIFTSALGRNDHHVAEALTMLGLCVWVVGRFPAHEFRLRSARARIGFELIGACIIVLGMFVFNGAHLYAAVALLPPLVATLREPSSGERGSVPLAGSGAPAAALASAITLALYLPGMLVHERWLSYVFPSLAQPALLAVAALVLAAAVLATRMLPDPAPGARKLGLRLALASALPLALALVVPDVRAELVRGVSQHLLRGDPWMADIAEFRPLVAAGDALSAQGWVEALRSFGPFTWLSPLLLPLGVRHAARRDLERAAAFGFCLGTMFVLTLLQSRFARVLGPLLATGCALGAAALGSLLLRRLRARMSVPRRTAGLAAVLAALLFAFAPAATRARLPLAEPRAPTGAQGASVFLARERPLRADGRRDATLTDWTSGHYLMWPAKSPIVVNGFGVCLDEPTFWQVQSVLSGSERDALAFMRQRDLRWFVFNAGYYAGMRAGPRRLRPIVAGAHGRGQLDVAFLQAVPLATLLLGGGGIPGAEVPHVQHLLPRWVSADRMSQLDFFVASAWVYERVRGAEIRGRTLPRSLVTAQIAFQARGHALPYAAFTTSDDQGRFTLRVALPSNYRTPTLSTRGHWVVDLPPDQRRTVEVSTDQVRSGSILEIEHP